jgi:hypothetical protein
MRATTAGTAAAAATASNTPPSINGDAASTASAPSAMRLLRAIVDRSKAEVENPPAQPQLPPVARRRATTE